MIHIMNILATWRISELVADESGPYKVLEKTRHTIASRARVNPHAKEVTTAINCVFCRTVYIGWLVAMMTGQKNWVWTGLAYSAGAILITQTYGRLGL